MNYITKEEALSLVSPWKKEQREVFLSKYESDKDFKKRLNSKLNHYIKDPMVLITADASQAEVRTAANLSGDDKLIQVFKGAKVLEDQGIEVDPKKNPEMRRYDLHYQTASNMYKKPIEKVTKEERSHAKTITFAVLYGSSAFGVAFRTGLTLAEAEGLIDRFWKAYPKLRAWVNSIVAECVANGFVSTPDGRRKVTPTLYNKRDFLEVFVKDGNPYFDLKGKYSYEVVKKAQREIRQARNYPVQSFTSDLIMLGVYYTLEECDKKNIPIFMHTIVHDAEVPSIKMSMLPEFLQIMKYNMEVRLAKEFDLALPIKLEAEVGFNYGAVVKLPYILKNFDWGSLPSTLIKKANEINAKTIIRDKAADPSYLFDEEKAKLRMITSKETKETGITNEDFKDWYEDYRVQWNLNKETLKPEEEIVQRLVSFKTGKEERIKNK